MNLSPDAHRLPRPAQQALVGRIAGSLQQKVWSTEQRRALAQPPKSLDVYLLTQRGKSMMEKYSPQGLRDARRLLEQALAIDADYALAWVFLGMTNTIDTQPQRHRLFLHPRQGPDGDRRARSGHPQHGAGARPQPDAAGLPAGFLRHGAVGRPTF
jgi:hypothetical protein